MKATRMALAAIGLALILLAGCATAPPMAGGGERASAQVLYRSSGFVDFESFSSLRLVVERAGAPAGDTYTLAATLMYNDRPHPRSLVIRVGQGEATLLDEHPRTTRQLIGQPRYITHLSVPLDRELVGRLGRAERIVVQYGAERITLTDGERRALQAFLAGAPGPG